MQLVALSQFVCLILLPVLSIRYVKSSYIWETNKAEVEIKDTSNHGTIEGSYAGYTSTSSESSTVQGDLLFLDDAFGCPGWNGSVPRPSNLADHVVFLRRTQACDDYKQALLVERAEGLVFFYTSVGGIKFLSAGNNKLDTTVVIIELKEDYVEELKGLPEANTPMVIIRSSTKPVEPSQTFYFVVFAFCILMALSCLWFVLSYLRKCCRNARTRQRPVSGPPPPPPHTHSSLVLTPEIIVLGADLEYSMLVKVSAPPSNGLRCSLVFLWSLIFNWDAPEVSVLTSAANQRTKL